MHSEAESAGLPAEEPSKEGAAGGGGDETKRDGPGPEDIGNEKTIKKLPPDSEQEMAENAGEE